MIYTTYQHFIDDLNRCNSDHFWRFNKSGLCPNFAEYENPCIFVKDASGNFVAAEATLVENVGIVIQPKG